ncbi:MAG TPA: polysaccharide biosynthesis C-terminal domain-containing protein [Chitinophagaceae bacterium]|jgi:O-antigen/teichoic acid export membrane protein|nr:polysaccharide biosynthesis C-terminal domain-containing protein [Chitinophagaceae bacterium]
MSNIRRQSIISSVVIYIGFAIGLLNIYLFTKQGLFTDPQFGLYNAFIAIATTMMAFANLAMPSYIYKFFPYYKDHLPPKKNDMITWALVVSSIGYSLVVVAGIVFKDLVVRKYVEHSPEIVIYYNWIFVLGYGLMIYTVLEAFSWNFHKSILTNFLREVQWRLFTTIIILLFVSGVIRDYDLFIKLFSFTYPAIAIILFLYLVFTKKIHFTFQVSKVTRRLFKSVWRFCSFLYVAYLIFNISLVFDSLVIGAVLTDALAKLAVYSLAQNIANIIQAPQRGIISASIAHLSKAWKDKQVGTIKKIYQRSSINQLVFSCGLYTLLVLNFVDAVNTFHLKESYLNGFYVFLLLGATKIVDMGTGVNSQIIGTSTFWRFEVISGIILLAIMLPLNYVFTKQYDIVGTAAAGLISMTVYNLIRVIFLWKKFNLFPFTLQSLYTLLLGGFSFGLCYVLFQNIHGLPGLFLRSIFFCILYGTGAVYFRLSPDIIPVWNSIKKRIGIRV